MSWRSRFGALALCGFVATSSLPAQECNGLRLFDVAAQRGLNFIHDRGTTGLKHLPETMGAGLAWLDADGDGRLDLYVVQSGPYPSTGDAAAANRLFLQQEDGRFVDRTEGSGAGHRGYGQGAVAADVDGDGDTDLYVSNVGPDALLLNDGSGQFTDGTALAGLGAAGWSASAAFADADGDGDLDLYVTGYLEYAPAEGFHCVDAQDGSIEFCDPVLYAGAADRFYRNRGDGTFEDATEAAGLGQAQGKGLGVLFTDLDDDGHPDLYVANDQTINFLFRNRGDGSFEDLSLLSGAGLSLQGRSEAGMGLALGDFDSDGDPDLLVSNFDVETNTFYRNLGGLTFEDASAPSGFGPASFNLLGFGLLAADFNRDGRLDGYVANGHIFEEPDRETVDYRQPDLLLLGDGKGGFVTARCGAAFERREVGRGAAAADFDDDGDIDIALVNSGGPLQLLLNEGSVGDWIGFELEMDGANRDAVGARVRVLTPDGTTRTDWRIAGDSYLACSDPRLHFGLGPGAGAVDVEVRWPDGTESRFPGLDRGAYWSVRPNGAPQRLAAAGSESPRPGFVGGPFLPIVGVLAFGLLLALVWWVRRSAR